MTRQPVGFAAPAGLPPAVLEKLQATILSAGRDKGLERQWTPLGVAARPLDGPGLKALLTEMKEPIRAVMQKAGMLRG